MDGALIKSIISRFYKNAFEAFFQKQGLKSIDSLHLALAKSCGCDIFLTTDDRLLRGTQKLDLKITVMNPVTWLIEVKKNER